MFKLSDMYKKHGNSSLEMKFYPTELVGFIIKDIQYKINQSHGLTFWVFNPSVIESTLFIKVATANLSEYVQHYVLKQSETMIHMPFNKVLQDQVTSEIKSISIYRTNIDHIETLYFDDFKLR